MTRAGDPNQYGVRPVFQEEAFDSNPAANLADQTNESASSGILLDQRKEVYMRNNNSCFVKAAETAGSGATHGKATGVNPIKAIEIAIAQTIEGDHSDASKAVRLRKIELAIDRYMDRAKKLWARDANPNAKVQKVREQAVIYLEHMKGKCRSLAAQCRVGQTATLN